MERSAQVECEKPFLTEWLVNMAGINPVAAWIPSGIGNDSRRTYNSRLRSLFCMAQSVVVLRVRGSPPCCIVLSCQGKISLVNISKHSLLPLYRWFFYFPLISSVLIFSKYYIIIILVKTN